MKNNRLFLYSIFVIVLSDIMSTVSWFSVSVYYDNKYENQIEIAMENIEANSPQVQEVSKEDFSLSHLHSDVLLMSNVLKYLFLFGLLFVVANNQYFKSWIENK